MRFETSQSMRLGQQMKLAPRMIQSMEILQLPMLALQERIEQELESNVALEQVEPGEGEGAADAPADGEREGADEFERLSDLEEGYREDFDSDYTAPAKPTGERDRKMDAMANVAARGESLTEQLLAQWRLAEVEEQTARVGERIIGYIDDDGLLGADLGTILEQNRDVPGVELTLELLEQTLAAIQSALEPPGLAARDVQEALLLEVDDLELRLGDEGDWEDVRLLIRDHLDDLVENRLPKIAEATELTMEEIADARKLMRHLNPAPGRELVSESEQPIIPDVIVEYDENEDRYVAALRDGFLPILRVSNKYSGMARDRSVDKETRDFAAQGVRNATWLIEAIDQRSNTVLRVVNVVLARQREFFDHGPQHLKPLPMIEVADLLGIHVGTVSRAVADKYLQTPRGMFPLRMFFSGGTETESGKDMSWEAVKATLREIIDAEDKSKPLSDEALSKALKERGIDIARRTVVKYRQQMGIPAARMRKEYT